MRRHRLFDGGRIVAGGPAVVFMHIQKTGGTTFAGHLRAHFDADQIAPPYWGDESSLQGMGDKRLVVGHITLDQATRFFPTAFLVTFLRHPVARVQSQYRSFHDPAKLTAEWRRRLPAEELRDVEFAQNATFDEFVLSDRQTIRRHLDNLQTSFLTDPGLRGRPAVEAAIRNLRTRIGFFGIQEHFDMSIQLFHWLTGSQRQLRVLESARNLSIPTGLELSREGRQRLAEYTALDAQLYAAARRRFWLSFMGLRLLPRPLRFVLG